MKDQYGRDIKYMRISVTDRCNLRCQFCMPKETSCFKEKEELLSFKEHKKIIQAAVSLGISHFRITGGEPLVRKGVVEFIRDIKKMDGVKGVYLSTNGVLLEENLRGLIEAGIDGINVSLCSTDPKEYERITGFDRFGRVRKAILKAADAGIHVKINTVPIAGMNEEHLKDLAAFAKDHKIEVRFIEMMPIGLGAGFPMISNQEVKKRLEAIYGGSSLVHKKLGNGPAVYWKFNSFQGYVGFISARTCAFCRTCNRIRLTSDGFLKLCLNYEDGISLKEEAREDAGIEVLAERMRRAIYHKPAHHAFDIREAVSYQWNTKYMAQIGG